MAKSKDERIEELAAEFLDYLLKGGDARRFRDQHISANPDLMPGLQEQLLFVESMWAVTNDSEDFQSFNSDEQTADAVSSYSKETGSATEFKRGDEVTANWSSAANERADRFECPHCGNHLKLITEYLAEVTCGNCGSIVTLNEEETRSLVSDRIPERIDRFEIQGILGKGGFGIAYLAFDPTLSRQVAVKIPRAGELINGIEKTRFLREARNASRLRHPGIVQVHEVGSENDIPFIVSDYIEGVTLSELINSQQLGLRELAEIMIEVSKAVHHAHENGIIHRDLKPGNIFLDASRKPFVADFGLARNLDGEITMTLDGDVLGTPAFMSPEQATGMHAVVNATSDVYSLGAMLYRMLCCENPFRGSVRMLIQQVLHDEPARPRSINEKIPRDLENITLKAMEKDQNRRYGSALELAEDLQRWLDKRPVKARPVSMMTRLSRWCNRHPVTAILSGLISTLLLTISIMSIVWAAREFGLRRTADENALLAAENELESRQRLMSLQVQNGLEKLNTGDHSVASLWFVEAISTAESVAAPENLTDQQLQEIEVQRLRTGMTLARLPVLNWVRSLSRTVSQTLTEESSELILVGDKSGTVTGVQADTGMTRFRLPHASLLKLVCFNEAVSRVVTVSLGKSAVCWDSVDGKRIAEFQHDGNVRSAVFSQDGSRVITAGDDGYLRRWSSQDGRADGQWKSPQVRVDDLAVLPDGDLIISAGPAIFGRPRDIYRIKLDDPDPFSAAPLFTDIVRIWFLNDAAEFAVLNSANQLSLHESLTNETIATFQLKENPPEQVLYQRQLQNVTLINTDGQIHAYSTNGKLVRSVRHPVSIAAAAVDGQHHLLAVAGTDGRFSVYWYHSLAPLCENIPVGDTASTIRFLPDKRRLVTGAGDGMVRCWDLAGVTRSSRRLDQRAAVSLARYSPDYQSVIAADDQGNVRLWNVQTGEDLGVILKHDGKVMDLNFSHDGKWIASAGVDQTVQVWSRDSGRTVDYPVVHSHSMSSIEFSPIEPILVAASSAGHVTAWNAATNRILFESQPTTQNILELRFSPDGGRIVSAGIGKLAVVQSIPGGDVVEPYLEHRDDLVRAGFSPDGETIWTAGVDNRVTFWDATESFELKSSLEFSNWPTWVEFIGESDFLTADKSGHIMRWSGENPGWDFHDPRFEFSFLNSPKSTRYAIACGTIHRGEESSPGAGGMYVLDRQTGLPVAPLFATDGRMRRCYLDPESGNVLTFSSDQCLHILPLIVEDRSAEELRDFLIVMTGESIDGANRRQNEPADVEELFKKLQTESPADYSATDDEINRWSLMLEWMERSQIQPLHQSAE